ncbi:MAG: hydantoinase B/oxoprolinase family protein [Thermoprotei archaeon]
MVSWEIVYKASVFIAEEMGVALKRSAFSPNIKERMDHSCAVLDSRGLIVAQAEHIPVHLGSFRVGVSNVLRWLKDNSVSLDEGDMIVLNDPYISGTHLNDVMMLAPIYYKGEIIAYVVNKAHQVDVGGPIPGSMNPNARTIYEEGLIIPPVKLVRESKVDSDVMRLIVENSKTPKVTLGDLNAQIAANRMGIRRVLELIGKYGLEEVTKGWSKAIEYGRSLSLLDLKNWMKGYSKAEDYIELGDEDITIRVLLEVRDDGIKADYTGSSRQVDAPLNAVYGVTFSATSYAIRVAMSVDVPINEGFYSIIEVIAPESTIVNPIKPAPVAGGNVETSQRIADVVLRALAELVPDRIPAAGSGTMMNVMIGGYDKERDYWAYYETIGGGTGGRPGKNGVSGVHVNMTNTLNTPIEVAERSYPIMYTMYMMRDDSGGKGLYRGGDGIIRAFKVLKPARLSILADRFRRRPYGLRGGEPGKPGRVIIKRVNGRIEEMPSKFTIDLNPEDEVIIETPGGGGWGQDAQ